jgi:hypothetical protein
MRHFITLLISIFLVSTVYAQGDLDFTKYANNLDPVKDEVQNLTDAVHAGMNVLDWTDGSCPSVFRFSVGVFAGFGSFDAQPEIGLDEKGMTPSGLGIQGGFGTAGFEAYIRFFPEIEMSDVKYKSLGFGLKYGLSDMIPIPMFPAVGIYCDYNTLNFGVGGKRDVMYEEVGLDPVKVGEVNAGIDMTFSTINIGLIVSKDLVALRIYGKLAYEIGKTEIDWNYASANSITQDDFITEKDNVEFTNNGLRYGVGISLFGIKAEAGARGSNLYVGVGYGISI